MHLSVNIQSVFLYFPGLRDFTVIIELYVGCVPLYIYKYYDLFDLRFAKHGLVTMSYRLVAKRMPPTLRVQPNTLSLQNRVS